MKKSERGVIITEMFHNYFSVKNCLPDLRCGTKNVCTFVKCSKLFAILDSLAALLDEVILLLLHLNSLQPS
jgi:hypothetical protein